MNFYRWIRKIYEFINNELRGGVSVLDVKGHYIKLLRHLELTDIEHEIYYTLDDGKLGVCNYCRIN